MFPEINKRKLKHHVKALQGDLARAVKGDTVPPMLRRRLVCALRGLGMPDEDLKPHVSIALDDLLLIISKAAESGTHLTIPGDYSLAGEYLVRSEAMEYGLILKRYSDAEFAASETLLVEKNVFPIYMQNDLFRKRLSTMWLKSIVAGYEAMAYFVLGKNAEGLDAVRRELKAANGVLKQPSCGSAMVAIGKGDVDDFKSLVHKNLAFYNDYVGESKAVEEIECIKFLDSAHVSLARQRGLIEDIEWLEPSERRWILWY